MSDNYIVNFHYKDGKNVNLKIHKEQLSQLFTRLGDKQFYWYGAGENPEDAAFWTNLDEVRVVHINKELNESKNENDCENITEHPMAI